MTYGRKHQTLSEREAKDLDDRLRRIQADVLSVILDLTRLGVRPARSRLAFGIHGRLIALRVALQLDAEPGKSAGPSGRG